MKFSIDGKKKIDGLQTVGLRFEEPKTREANYLLKTPGKAAARGRFWVDPATGRIHRTELTMESSGEFIRITVEYGRDAALDLWLPTTMVDSYEVSETVSAGMHVMGTGSPGVGRRSFDCRASYSKASFTPIQLNVK